MLLSDVEKNRYSTLLASIRVGVSEFDEFLSNSPHILRSLRGHAFEVWFDREMAGRGYLLDRVGGDTVVDRKFNTISLQLKTPWWNGTIENEVVQYKMHKTHGSERKPLCYYKKSEFADFLVALHPRNGVIICPKKKLKTRGEISSRLNYKEYIADPLPFEWDTEWLNRYELLGMEVAEPPALADHTKEECSLLPKTILEIGFMDYDIVHAILDKSNFRIWNQLIRGSIREFHFGKFARRKGVKLFDPSRGELDGRERQKVDYLLQNGKRIQAKGLTTRMCGDRFLGCETQCSHGRVPTRLYKTSDFDYLVIVIDPNVLPVQLKKIQDINTEEYNFLIIPMSRLPIHPRSEEWDHPRIKSRFLFDPLQETYNNIEILETEIGN